MNKNLKNPIQLLVIADIIFILVPILYSNIFNNNGEGLDMAFDLAFLYYISGMLYILGLIYVLRYVINGSLTEDLKTVKEKPLLLILPLLLLGPLVPIGFSWLGNFIKLL